MKDNVINRVRELIRNERVCEAISLLEVALAENDEPRMRHWLARCHQITGDAEEARRLLISWMANREYAHIVDVITAQNGYIAPLVSHELKLIYFPIPKCGSTSIKDAFMIARSRESVGERAHRESRDDMRLMRREELNERYSDYMKFAVIRSPRRRLRAYWQKNIDLAGSLAAESEGRDSYYGLSTHPSYREVLSNFHQYRNVFRDFRHHTDRMIDYFGGRIEASVRLFTLDDISAVFRLISQRARCDIPYLRHMASESPFPIVDDCLAALEAEIVENFYSEDVALFTCARAKGNV